MRLTPGRRFGGYEIQAGSGAGGMGQVYRARDSRLGRDVAIKIPLVLIMKRPKGRASPPAGAH